MSGTTRPHKKFSGLAAAMDKWRDTTRPAHVRPYLQQPAELHPLVLRVQELGEEEDVQELAWRMKPLVINLALKYGDGKTADGHNRYTEAQRHEMTQEAWVGLFDAVERYDPEIQGKDGKPKPFWTVAGYRIGRAIQVWQAQNSGGIKLTRHAWEQAYRIDRTLEAAGLEEWEEASDKELKEATGVPSAGDILRARKPGHTLYQEDAEAASVSPSAEDEALSSEDPKLQLADWLLAAEELTEHDVYSKLEALGLADEVEAQHVLEVWQQRREQ